MRTKQNYGWLDRFRVFVALLAITNHTSALSSVNAGADFFLTRVLARIVVPFFFMVTGQFVASGFLSPSQKNGARLIKYIRKTALFYAFCILLYLPIGIYAGHYENMTVGSVLRLLIFDGTFYHLWYFPACIVGMLLFYLMSHVMSLQAITAVSAVLYVIGLFGDSYYGLAEKVPVLNTIYGFGFQIFSYTRNGLFIAPLFLVLGAWMAGWAGNLENKSRAGTLRFCITGLAVSFAVMTIEAFTLRHFELQRHDSMYVALVPTMIFLYQCLLCLPKKPSKSCRTISTWIYILHPAFIVVVRAVAKLLKLTELLVANSVIHYLAVTLLSVAASLFAVYVEEIILPRLQLPQEELPERVPGGREMEENELPYGQEDDSGLPYGQQEDLRQPYEQKDDCGLPDKRHRNTHRSYKRQNDLPQQHESEDDMRQSDEQEDDLHQFYEQAYDLGLPDGQQEDLRQSDEQEDDLDQFYEQEKEMGQPYEQQETLRHPLEQQDNSLSPHNSQGNTMQHPRHRKNEAPPSGGQPENEQHVHNQPKSLQPTRGQSGNNQTSRGQSENMMPSRIPSTEAQHQQNIQPARTLPASNPQGKKPQSQSLRKKRDLFARAWIEVDSAALKHNVSVLRALLPEHCRLMPAVKADAYGHGLVIIAKLLSQIDVDAFCVACLSEGITLREAGIMGEILILGYTSPADLPLVNYYQLTQAVVDYEYALMLKQYGKPIHVHVAIDTGMHRLGIRCENIEEILAVYEMQNLVIDGLFTHLAASDSLLPQDKAFTSSQISAFYDVVDILRNQGYDCHGLHLAASYGILNLLTEPDARDITLADAETPDRFTMIAADYVRPGIALYGVLSTEEDYDSWRNMLRPVLSLKARVISVRTLYAGEAAGYGMAFTAEEDMRIATICIGYADGLPRELSYGKGSVLINGYLAPIIGRICMDQAIVDVSMIPDLREGDIAVIIGKSGEEEITVGNLAQQCNTITNEILSRLGARLERVLK